VFDPKRSGEERLAMAKGKQQSTNALRRQWALVRKIPRHPQKKTAAQIASELEAEGFEVEKRTVERDLVALTEIFPAIECDDRERPYGWSWAKDSPGLHLPGMTAAEALAFQMIERFIKPLLPASIVDGLQPYLRASRAKLNEATASRVASWTKKVRVVHPTQVLIAPKINPAVHHAVTEALLKDRQMEIVYHRRWRSNTVTHIVNPLALVQRGPITYFVVSQSRDPFYLAMHRIAKAGILDTPAQRPAGFDLDEHIASGHMGFGAGNMVRLEAIFDKEVAEHLHESPLSADQRLVALDEKRMKLMATVPHNQQLEWWLLGFGEKVEVLGPAEIRNKIAQTALAMVRSYGLAAQSPTRQEGASYISSEES
jgi:predicted DNA-binding transcriptional regulator YafY